MQVSNLPQLAHSQSLDTRAVTTSRVASPGGDESHAVTRSLADSKISSDSYERGDRLQSEVVNSARDSAALTDFASVDRTHVPKTGDDSNSEAVVGSGGIRSVAVTQLAGAGNPTAGDTDKAVTDLAGRMSEPSKPQKLTDLADSVPTNTKTGAVVEPVAIDPADPVAVAQSLEDESASLTGRGSSVSRIHDMVNNMNDLRLNFMDSARLAHTELQGDRSDRLGIKVQEQLIARLESLVNQSPPEPSESKTFLDAAADHQRQAIDAFVSADSMTKSGAQFMSIA